MLQQNGLFCAVKVLAVLVLVCIAMPAPVSAQSNQYTRVEIQSDNDNAFGDVLLVRDQDEIVIYGLTGAVPPLSQVTLDDGTTSISRNASFTGKFPIRSDLPARFPASAESVTVTAQIGEQTFTGTLDMTVGGDEALQAIRTYKEQADAVLAGERTFITDGMPPHVLLDIVAEDEANADKVGKVLLTQRLIGEAGSAIIVDQIEGISNGGTDTSRFQSVPNFAQIEFYSEPVNVDNPDRTKRLQVVDTANFIDGQFISNGSFLAISFANNNSSTADTMDPTWYLRIVDNVNNERFLARIENDVTVELSETPTAIPNNPPLAENAPRGEGIARIIGQTDPYALVIPYEQDPETAPDPEDNLLTSPVTADGDGNYEIIIPPYAPIGEVYENRQVAFLGSADALGNESDTIVQITLDTESFFAEAPVANDQGDGSISVQGVAEPRSIIVITGRHDSESPTDTFAAAVLADDDGAFDVSVDSYFEYDVTAYDQAGNVTTVTIPGDQSTINPFNLAAMADFPNIIITGEAERNATVIIYAYPLNQVPESPSTLDEKPDEAFFVNSTVAASDGTFSVSVPSSISQIVLVQAVDASGNPSQYVGFELLDEDGNPLGDASVDVHITSVDNSFPRLPDIVNGQLRIPGTTNPIDVSEGNFQVVAFRSMISDATDGFPFANALSNFTPVTDSEATFSLSIPERDPQLGDYLYDFYVVALQTRDDGSLQVVGFTRIDGTTSDLFDRIGPSIRLAPRSSDLVLEQHGKEQSDILHINRIYPAGVPNAGGNALPADAMPFILLLVDSNDDDQIDVTDPNVRVLAMSQLHAANGLPLPGAPSIDLGINYYDPTTQSLVGRKYVFAALMDQFGNLSPNPIVIELDVETKTPDGDLIEAIGTQVFGEVDSVEPNAKISLYEDAALTKLVATTTADTVGRFFIGGSFTQSELFIIAKDEAGNQSGVTRVRVKNPIKEINPIVLDGFGGMHSLDELLASAALPTDVAVALAPVPNDPTSLYMLLDNGLIAPFGAAAREPDFQLDIDGKFAQDLEVISSSPFAGYVLLGNGVIIPYGDAPFYGDLFTMQFDREVPARLHLEGNLFFEDLNDNGVRDSEDLNGNGQLDVIVGIGGQIISNEDTNGNGILDVEPSLNAALLSQGFGFDIARDLELVYADDGSVKGYVILDGFGVMWAFGEDINAEIISPDDYNGYFNQDIVRAFELVVEDGQIIDFITLNGYGQVFGSPGGPLGAGVSTETDSDNAGILTGVLNATTFAFDIARDLEVNPVDSNGDGEVNYLDGFYVLDGFGGISPLGAAEDLEDSLFLGFDIARDLEFGTTQ